MQAKKEIAAILARLLNHYWVPNLAPEAWEAQIDDWISDLAEFRVEVVRRACDEWRRTQTRRPVPAEIRRLCLDDLAARDERIALADQRSERWPKWLADIWGPEPDGPQKRAEHLAQLRHRNPAAHEPASS